MNEEQRLNKLDNGSDTALWAAARIRELKEELLGWVTQKGCKCGHPACSNCKDTKDARKLLNT